MKDETSQQEENHEFNPRTEHEVRLENISLKKQLAELRAEHLKYKDAVQVLTYELNKASDERDSLEERMNNISNDAESELKECYKRIDTLKAELNNIKHDASPYSSRGYVTIDGRDFYAPELIEKLKAENERVKNQVIDALTANTLIKESFTAELQRRWPSDELILGHKHLSAMEFESWLKYYLNK
jgi:DNA repair exonuclease SbcCD ATPase subunit